jgi:hypothetical protein
MKKLRSWAVIMLLLVLLACSLVFILPSVTTANPPPEPDNVFVPNNSFGAGAAVSFVYYSGNSLIVAGL